MTFSQGFKPQSLGNTVQRDSDSVSHFALMRRVVRRRPCIARYQDLAANNPSEAVHEYLHQRLALDLKPDRDLSHLSIERDLEPNVALLLSIQSPQRVLALLQTHPELLGVQLQDWQEFLMEYGISKHFFFKLLATHSRLFIDGSLFIAGQNMMYLQSLGLSCRDISAHIIPKAADVLFSHYSQHMQQVVSFLTAPSQHDSHDQAQPQQEETGLGLSKEQLRSLLSRCPRVLLMSVEHQLKPKVDYLRNGLGLTADEARTMLCRNSSLLLGDIQPQIQDHLKFLTQTCGFNSQQSLTILVQCADFMVFSISNLQRKWRYLQGTVFSPETHHTLSPQIHSRQSQTTSLTAQARVIDETAANALESAASGTSAQAHQRTASSPIAVETSSIDAGGSPMACLADAREAILAYPQSFSSSLLNDLGPRFSYARDRGLLHHLLDYNDQAHSVRLSLKCLLDCDTTGFLTRVQGHEDDFMKYYSNWRRSQAALLTITNTNLFDCDTENPSW